MTARAHIASHRLVACLAIAALTAPALVVGRDTPTLEWNFDVSLDERAIGEHRFTLRTDDESRELTSEASFRVRILFIDAYRYEHRARERWKGDCLESLEARTDTNGKTIEVSGERASRDFRVQTAGTAQLLDDCVQTFAYWNPSILDARRLLNPQTGEYVDVKVLHMGREVMAGKLADRYRLSSRGRTPLEIDIWYTPARDWVALESRTPEGRRLRYTRR
jgi:hypothetical protein